MLVHAAVSATTMYLPKSQETVVTLMREVGTFCLGDAHCNSSSV